MIVWVVESGYDYDGCSIDAIFSSKQKAIWFAKNKVKIDKKQSGWFTNPRRRWNKAYRRPCYNNQGDVYYQTDRDPKWKREDNRWRKSGQWIAVREWKVI